MIDQAFSECSGGIFQAQEKCLGVIEALGTVYLQARDVLDRINPERWAPHSHVALHKRQVIPGNRYVLYVTSYLPCPWFRVTKNDTLHQKV